MFSRVLIPCSWISFSIFYSMRSRVFVKEIQIFPVCSGPGIRRREHRRIVSKFIRKIEICSPICLSAGMQSRVDRDMEYRSRSKEIIFQVRGVGDFDVPTTVFKHSRVCFNIHGAKVEENSRPNGSHCGTSGRICLLLPFY